MNTLSNPRIPRVADEGRDAATRLLLENGAKTKLTASQRRALNRQRDVVVDYERTRRKPFFNRVQDRMLALPLVRLFREYRRAVRREREAARLIESLGPYSTLAEPMKVSQATNKAIALIAREEIDRRASLANMDRPHDGEPHNDNNVTGPTA